MIKKTLAATVLLIATQAATAATPVGFASVTSTGSFADGSSLSVVYDGLFPAEGTPAGGAGTLAWEGQTGGSGAVITFAFDQAYSLSGMALSADGDHNFRVQVSSDGTGWATLVTLVHNDGNVNGGMDTLQGSNVGGPDYLYKLDFSATLPEASFARIYAVGNPNDTYALGEVAFFGTAVAAVPEPASHALWAAGVAMLGWRARRQMRRG